jgi:hypothetical protein
MKKNNSSKLNGILNRTFYRLINNRSALLVRFFDVYYRLNINFTVFKRVITILLRKLKKVDYSNSKIYHLMALLNILEKALKIVITERI